MIRACIIGCPAKHSRSPLIHTHWLKVHGLEGVYDRVEVPPDGLARFLTELAPDRYRGANVTVPHKEAAFGLAVVEDPVARVVGAVNTLWYEDRRLHGCNTDVEGFLANLDEAAPGWDRRLPSVVVLGAGGAAKAVVHGLLERGAESVRLLNRSPDAAHALAERFGRRIKVGSLDDQSALAGASLLVNTTSLGMVGQPPLAIDLSPLDEAALVTDLVYAPLETDLLRQAKARALRTVDGLGMLLHQAVPGFERWFGLRPNVTCALRALVEADLRTGA